MGVEGSSDLLRRVVLFTAAILSGCVSYPLSNQLAGDISPSRTLGAKESGGGELYFAGDIADAIDAANGMRAAYILGVRRRSDAHDVAGAAIVLLSATALY